MKLFLTNPDNLLTKLLRQSVRITLPDGRIGYQLSHIEFLARENETFESLHLRVLDYIMDLADETGLEMVASPMQQLEPFDECNHHIVFGMFDRELTKLNKNVIYDPAILICWYINAEGTLPNDVTIPATAIVSYDPNDKSDRPNRTIHPVSKRRVDVRKRPESL